jgi:cell division protein FtsI/penicillin-binding protein 2
VVTVLIEEGEEGSTAAVPVARDVILWWATNR